MLIISRERNEAIVVADDVIVTVIEIRGDKVRLGIDVPPGVPVHRKENVDALRKARDEANQPPEESDD